MAAVRRATLQRVDVLIVTAVPEEYAAVLAVDTGAAPGSAWEARTASTGLELRVRPFVAAGAGCSLSARGEREPTWFMGGVEAVGASAQLVPASARTAAVTAIGRTIEPFGGAAWCTLRSVLAPVRRPFRRRSGSAEVHVLLTAIEA